MVKRLTWRGNIEAEAECRRAFNALRNKRGKKKRNAKQQRPHSGAAAKGVGKNPFAVVDSKSYERYLKSKWWKGRRKQALAAAGETCQRCGTKRFLHVHHLSYSRLWREKKADLEVLCRDCYKTEHRAQSFGLSVDDVGELDAARQIAAFL